MLPIQNSIIGVQNDPMPISLIFDSLPIWKKSVINFLNINLTLSPLISLIVLFFMNLKIQSELNKKVLWVGFIILSLSNGIFYLSMFGNSLNIDSNILSLIASFSTFTTFVLFIPYVLCFVLAYNMFKSQKSNKIL